MRNKNGFASTFILFGILALFLIVMSILLFTMNNSSVLNSGITNKLTNKYEQNEKDYIYKDYIVSAELNGGDGFTSYGDWTQGTPATKSIRKGSNYGQLPIPTRNGYNFDGWYTESVNGSKIDNNQSITMLSNHSIYAQWSYNATPTITNYMAENGTKIEITAPGAKCYLVTKNNVYSFSPGECSGQWTNKNTIGFTDGGLYRIYVSDGNKVSSKTINVEVYKIIYNSNDSTSAKTWTDPRIFINGQKYYYDDNNPLIYTNENSNLRFTRSGYRFNTDKSWGINKAGSTKFPVGLGSNTNDYVWPSDYKNGIYGISNYILTLYAQWSR